MSAHSKRMKIAGYGLALLCTSAAISTTAQAQDAASAPSESAMVNLVRMLVDQGVLTKEKGQALMAQAQREATAAREGKPQADLPAPAPGTIRVPYVPETVRQQIKNELRTEVLAQAKQEGWASKDQAAPEWTRRITLSGDVRIRSQSDLFSKTNSNLIPDFNAFNVNGPTDLQNGPLRFLNTRRDKINQLRFRARLNVLAQVSDKVQVGLQLASGDDNSPISLNSSLGGGLAKRSLWLQQAYVKLTPTPWSKISAGRFANPFLFTDLLFDEDLAFDGVAAEVKAGTALGKDWDISLRGGAFPLDFGNPNFPTTSFDKSKIPQRYLFSGQIEAGYKVTDDVEIRVAGAYHHFTHMQGRLSAPCDTFNGAVECSTDYERPFFLRKGNTLGPLRNIFDRGVPSQPIPQFAGLAFNYHILDVNAEVRFPVSDTIGAVVHGNYLRNLAFKRRDVCRYGAAGEPFNNGGANGDGHFCGTANPTSFVGGNQGYEASLTLGHRNVTKWGQWQMKAGYRYLESDAVLDSLTDANFHLGGTNSKGYFLGGKMGLFPGTTLGAKWMSANEIKGEALSIDVFQMDLEAHF